jgi:hypothetical protein
MTPSHTQAKNCSRAEIIPKLVEVESVLGKRGFMLAAASSSFV